MIPARVLGYSVPRIPPPILGICRCPQDAPRVPGRQLAFSDVLNMVLNVVLCGTRTSSDSCAGTVAGWWAKSIIWYLVRVLSSFLLENDKWYSKSRRCVAHGPALTHVRGHGCGVVGQKSLIWLVERRARMISGTKNKAWNCVGGEGGRGGRRSPK